MTILWFTASTSIISQILTQVYTTQDVQCLKLDMAQCAVEHTYFSAISQVCGLDVYSGRQKRLTVFLYNQCSAPPSV